MLRYIVIFLLALWLAPASVFAEQSLDVTPEEILSKIQTSLSAVKTLETDFEQIRHLKVFEESLVSKGKLYFITPDQLRWETRNPYQTAFIFNQGDVARFEVKNGSLNKMNLPESKMFSEVMNQMMKILKGDFSAVEKEYNITVHRQNGIEIVLTPHSESMAGMITSITLFLHPDKLRVNRLLILEGSEDKLEILFSNEKENQVLDMALFSLSNPVGFNLEVPE
ncbi:MAG: outer membrane lipoprotein carrier protein LolA [Desulfobacterales bacterium]|nr:outer membrane lipoprotein carrier protein LolA [Desulfobacterales bacterium]